MVLAQGAQSTAERENIVGRTLRSGEYQVQQIIERDRRAWIFLAMHTSLMIPVALKQLPADKPAAAALLARLDSLLHAEDKAEFMATPTGEVQADSLPEPDGTATNLFIREALLLAQLHHTAIPTLYDYFREDGYWYLVMDYVPGHALTTYLQQHGPLSALEALNCALQICDALDYLHTQTPAIVLHDLTTDSVRVTPEGLLVLVNFVAYLQRADDEESEATPPRKPAHHPGDTEMEMLAYMPGKEQVPAKHNSAISLDVYNLGIMLREMLYGKRLEQGEHPSYSPQISTYLKSLVRLATRPEPMDRFQSTQTFFPALERAYQIEEQLAFQGRLLQTRQISDDLLKVEVAGQAGETPGTDGPEAAGQKKYEQSSQRGEDTPPITLSRTLELEQRQLTRAALQRARRERIEQERIEAQLASVDESLQQRANVTHSQISLQALGQAEMPTPAVPIGPAIPVLQRFQRMVKVNFALALILCIILVSLLVSVRIAIPLENSVHTLMQHPLSSAESDNSLQSISGVGAQNAQNPADGLDTSLTDNYWQALPSLPRAEADNAAVYVELQGHQYIYMNGGYHGSPPTAYDHNFYRYDIKAAHWETLSTGHFPGMVNNAATVDEQGHIFFTAGYSSETYTVTSLLYIYDPGTDFLQKVIPPAEMQLGFGGSIFADRQGHLYISQGFLHAGDLHTQAGTGWYRYDIGTGRWHSLAPLPVGLGYVFTASDNNGGILLLGGASDAGQHDATNKIYRYDIASDSWSQANASLPTAISGAAGCQIWPGQLAIAGGYDAAHNIGSKSAWLLDLHTLQWRSLVDLTIGGSVLGAAACDGAGHLFLERGTSDPRIPTSDYWSLTVAPGIKINN